MNAEPTPYQSPNLISRLEALRNTWSSQANALERIYGQNNAAARSLRCCIGDLYYVLNPNAGDIETVKQP